MQGPENYRSAAKTLENHLKFENLHRYQIFSLLQPLEMASLSKERLNRSTNNGDMVEKTERDVVLLNLNFPG